MYVVFARDRYCEITIGGKVLRVAADDAESACLREYFQKYVRTDLTQRIEAWQRAFTEFKELTCSEWFEAKEGALGNRNRVAMIKLTFPNGSSTECRASEDEETMRRTFIREKGPCPSADYTQWRSDSRASAELHRRWVGIAFHADGSQEELDVDLSDWRFGAPLASMTKILNQFRLKRMVRDLYFRGQGSV